jgi:hypothetical protein
MAHHVLRDTAEKKAIESALLPSGLEERLPEVFDHHQVGSGTDDPTIKDGLTIW